jgi:hypothetical protein
MAFFPYDSGSSEPTKDELAQRPSPTLQAVVGPAAVDQMIRQGITMCWMLLPKERRTVPEIRPYILRVVDRVLSNIEEEQKFLVDENRSNQGPENERTSAIGKGSEVPGTDS